MRRWVAAATTTAAQQRSSSSNSSWRLYESCRLIVVIQNKHTTAVIHIRMDGWMDGWMDWLMDSSSQEKQASNKHLLLFVLKAAEEMTFYSVRSQLRESKDL
jgi:hypothetical protein